MTNSINVNVSTHLKLVKWISSAVLISGFLLTSGVSADEQYSVQQTSDEVAPVRGQKPLMDWSKKVTISLNEKMERKLEDILIQAEYSRLYGSDSNNKLASIANQ